MRYFAGLVPMMFFVGMVFWQLHSSSRNQIDLTSWQGKEGQDSDEAVLTGTGLVHAMDDGLW